LIYRFTKKKNHLSPQINEHKKEHEIWDLKSILGRVNKCGWVKLVNGNTKRYKQIAYYIVINKVIGQ
jgi:hypothetical protein